MTVNSIGPLSDTIRKLGEARRMESKPVMIVYIVMGNDFLAGVFDTAHAAEQYCEAQREAAEKRGSKIYWRSVQYTINEAEPIR